MTPTWASSDPKRWANPLYGARPCTLRPRNLKKPRRLVYLQKLNQACLRQTHPTKAPFLQCMVVPPNSKKTVLDAWNGYHSVQLREDDRHLTTFLMTWGRYKYCNLQQGHMAAGDAYTARYNEIT